MKQILLLIFFSGINLYAQLPFPSYSPAPASPLAIDNTISSGYTVGGVTYYGYTSKQEIVAAQNGPVVINSNSYTDYNSEYVVTLKPGFDVNNLGPISVFSANTSSYNADNDPLLFSAAIMSNHPNADVGAYERFEIGLDPGNTYLTSIENFLTGSNGINPYDPGQIRFEAVITYTSPASLFPIVLTTNSTSFNGFYYKDFSVTNNSFTPLNTPYPFRIRMALPWHFVAFANTNVVDLAVRMYVNGVQKGGVFKNQVTIHNTNKKGFIHINNKNKLYADRKAAYLGIGQGIGYAEEPIEYGYNHGSFVTQRGYISDLAAKGGNFLRLRMDPWSNGVEWEEAGVYGSQRTYNNVAGRAENFDRQFHAWELDKTLELCEALDINMMLCLEQDQVLSDYDPYSHNYNYKYLWPSPGHTDSPRHPYAGLTGVNGNIIRVFTDQQARDFFKQRLYYVNARFGYSAAIGMYQLMNETDNIGVYGTDSNGNLTHYNDNSSWQSDINGWHCEMANFLKASYPYHIVMTGYGVGPQAADNSYACMDIDSRNHYDNERNQNFDKRKILVTPQSKAFVFGELGSGCADVDKCSDISFHNAIWANAFKGHLTNGLYWNDWKDQNNLGHRNNFSFMNNFFNTVDFDNTAWYPGLEKNINIGVGSHKEIYSFFMTDQDKKSDKAIGFAYNYAYEPATNGCSRNEIGCAENNQGGANIYSANTSAPQVVVGQLRPFTKYDIEIYDAHYGTVLPPKNNQNTGFDTKLKFRVNLGWQDNNGVSPSIVYKITRSNCAGCRKSRENEEFTFDYEYPINDTFNLSMPDDMGYQNIIWTNGNMVIKNETNTKYSFQKAGKYTIYTKFNDSDDKQYFVTNNVTIIDYNKPVRGIEIFPNPTNGIINISYGDIKGTIKAIVIYDASGKIILSEKETDNINIDGFSNGLYFIRIIQNDGTTSTYRIIKN